MLFLTFLLLLIFNFALPAFFDRSDYISLGPVFLLPFVVFTFYAILKHNFLDIKVISTEVIAFFLIVAAFSQILLSESVGETLFLVLVFVLLLVFSILLIRSVLREVRQREELGPGPPCREREERVHTEDHHERPLRAELRRHLRGGQPQLEIGRKHHALAVAHDGPFGRLPETLNAASFKNVPLEVADQPLKTMQPTESAGGRVIQLRTQTERLGEAASMPSQNKRKIAAHEMGGRNGQAPPEDPETQDQELGPADMRVREVKRASWPK